MDLALLLTSPFIVILTKLILGVVLDDGGPF